MVWPVGTRLQNKYEIKKELGRGGFGITYLVHHTELNNKPFVVKVPQVSDYFKSFEREIATLAKLDGHRHIVKITDKGKEADWPYLVLEYVDGQTLEAVVQQGPPSEKQLVQWLKQIGEAVGYLHQKRYIHRDLNPKNIMIRDSGEVVLIDFGLVREIAPNAYTYSAHFGFAPWEQLPLREMFGEIMDQLVPERPVLSYPADIYCLAASAYYAITGRAPTQSLERFMSVKMNKPDPWVPPNKHCKLSDSLNAALTKGMAFEPKDRPQSIQAFLALLNLPVSSGLQTFQFETVRVDERGKIVQRKTLEGQQWIEDLGNGITLELVQIPGGTFLMGSPANEAERSESEGPQHSVTVASFLLGKFQVTQAQWRRVAAMQRVSLDLNPDPSYFKGAKRPVEGVSWEEATEFCARLSRVTKRAYRLPSEAEWEYACRAGTTSPFAFGPTLSPEIANYDGNCPYSKGLMGVDRQKTTDVGSFPANDFGLYDMHGNVWEWCEDWWYDNYDGAPNDGSARATQGTQPYRLLRGGSWDSNASYCRSADRNWDDPGDRYDGIGFRLSCSFSGPRT